MTPWPWADPVLTARRRLPIVACESSFNLVIHEDVAAQSRVLG